MATLTYSPIRDEVIQNHKALYSSIIYGVEDTRIAHNFEKTFAESPSISLDVSRRGYDRVMETLYLAVLRYKVESEEYRNYLEDFLKEARIRLKNNAKELDLNYGFVSVPEGAKRRESLIALVNSVVGRAQQHWLPDHNRKVVSIRVPSCILLPTVFAVAVFSRYITWRRDHYSFKRNGISAHPDAYVEEKVVGFQFTRFLSSKRRSLEGLHPAMYKKLQAMHSTFDEVMGFDANAGYPYTKKKPLLQACVNETTGHPFYTLDTDA